MAYVYKLILTALAGAGLAVAITGASLYKIVKNYPKSVAVIDILSMTNERTEQIQKGSGPSEDKTREMGKYAESLSTQIEKLAQECHCVLVNKAAVLSSNAPDMTATLKARTLK